MPQAAGRSRTRVRSGRKPPVIAWSTARIRSRGRPLPPALVGDRGVGEPIRDHRLAPFEGGSDHLGDVLRPVGEEEGELGFGAQGAVFFEQQPPDRLAGAGGAGIMGQGDRPPRCAQCLRDPPGESGLPGPGNPLEGQEQRRTTGQPEAAPRRYRSAGPQIGTPDPHIRSRAERSQTSRGTDGPSLSQCASKAPARFSEIMSGDMRSMWRRSSMWIN